MEWVILILISALLMSFKDVIIKKILNNNHTLPFSLLFSGLCSIGLLIFYKNIIFILPLKIYGLLFIKAMILGVAWILIFKAIKHMEISVVAPLTNLSPIFLLILGYIFLGERISNLNLVGVGLLMFAGYSLEIKSWSELAHPFKAFKNKYFLYVVIVLILYSVSAIFDKFLIQYVNPYTFLFFMNFYISLIFLVYLVYLKKLNQILYIWNNSKKLILATTILAIVGDLAYFMAVAIPGTLITLIIPLKRVSNFFTVLIGGKMFHEDHLLRKGVISLVMLAGIYLIII